MCVSTVYFTTHFCASDIYIYGTHLFDFRCNEGVLEYRATHVIKYTSFDATIAIAVEGKECTNIPKQGR